LFEFVEFSVVSLHAFKLIIIGPDPCLSSEVVFLPVGTNLWDIWEVVVVELSSGKFDVGVQVRWDILLPSSGFLENVGTFVSRHGISPVVVDSIPFAGGGVISPFLAVSSIFVGDGSLSSSVYNVSGGLPESAKAFSGEGVAGVGGLSSGVILGEVGSVSRVFAEFLGHVNRGNWVSTGNSGSLGNSGRWGVEEIRDFEAGVGGESVIVDVVSGIFLSAFSFVCFVANSDSIRTIISWLGEGSAVFGPGTVWGGETEVSLPLLVGLVLEESPEISLSLR